MLAFAAAMSSARAQETGTITGNVFDEVNAPLEGVRFRVVEAARTAVSDDDGAFEISSVTPGTYHLIASYGALRVECGEIEIGGRWITTVHLQLGVDPATGEPQPLVRIDAEPDRSGVGVARIIPIGR